MVVKAVRGFSDILPEEIPTWRKVEEEARRVLEAFGFREIRIPVLERTELFARSIGGETDIVQKEMYSFLDRGGDSVTLRPEATASIARAYIEHRLYSRDPEARLYFIGPMFRYERPQKGRLRQFHQINAEVFGVSHPMVDAEVMALLVLLLSRCGLTEHELQINSLGCPRCREGFRETLKAFLEERTRRLCQDCLRRKERNPLRVFDCKVKGCQEVMEEAPLLEDHLCDECKDHFLHVRSYLEELKVPYSVNPRMVRGLDYYTKTVFEVHYSGLGAQDALCGGGRYDNLIEDLGGPSLGAVGWAAGVERILMALEAAEQTAEPEPLDLYIVTMGEAARAAAFGYLTLLRRAGLAADTDYEGRSLKAQMRSANKLGARFVTVIGDCLLYTSPSPRDLSTSRMPSSA